MLAALAALGAGFDCASEHEAACVLGLGVHPSRIIWAHPIKPRAQLRWAAKRGLASTVFDCESELDKV